MDPTRQTLKDHRLIDLQVPAVAQAPGITVATFIDHIFREAGCRERPFGVAEFNSLSPAHSNFLMELHQIGYENYLGYPGELPPDVDAATLLSTSELIKLLTEFSSIHASYGAHNRN